MYLDASVSLKWVLMSKTDSLLNLSPLGIVASKKVVSKRDISDVNLMVGGVYSLVQRTG